LGIPGSEPYIAVQVIDDLVMDLDVEGPGPEQRKLGKAVAEFGTYVRPNAWSSVSEMANSRRRAAAVTCAILLVVGPTLTVEEFWHGRPMIDQPGNGWIVAVCIVVVTFFVGGVVARRWSPDSATAGLRAGASAAVVLVAADIVRRLAITHQGLPWEVVALWLAGSVISSGLSAAGGWVGWPPSTHARAQPPKPGSTDRQ
jgi:hypothetical protein